MSTSLIPVSLPPGEPPFALTHAQTILRQMVLDSVKSIHSKRNYAKALDDLFAFCASRPLSRALLIEYRTTIDHLSASTINVRFVGVVKNIKARTIDEDLRPVLYRSINQTIAHDPSAEGYTIMARYEGDPAALIDAMQHQIHAIDPSLAIFNIKTMEEHVHEALFLQRLVGTVFTVFAITGLLLALIGLYGVMSYSVNQRTKEIGVRMALGARAVEVQRMIVRGGMRLALLAVALGLPMALAAAKLTTNLLYGVKPWDVATFTLVPLLLVAVSLLACWIPSRRASRVDPMVALRVD